jgi:hypothetical protein
MTPRAAITAGFFVNGAPFAPWASRVPAFFDYVSARNGMLGLALLAPARGGLRPTATAQPSLTT